MNKDLELKSVYLNEKTISYRHMGQGQKKILFFHGFPGSSAQIQAFFPHLENLDIEVLALDRPGYNLSTQRPQDPFAQASEDAMALLQYLGWKNCEVLAVSGGTPFLFAFTQRYPHIVTNLIVVSGLGPVAHPRFRSSLSRLSRGMLRILPLLPSEFLRRLLMRSREKESRAKNVLRFFLPASSADLKIMQESSVQEMLMLALREAFAQKGLGPQSDAKAYLSLWPLHLPNYMGPIRIWHGAEDRIIAPSMAYRMAEALSPRTQLHIVSDEGHYSLAVNRLKDILSPSKRH